MVWLCLVFSEFAPFAALIKQFLKNVMLASMKAIIDPEKEGLFSFIRSCETLELGVSEIQKQR